MEIVVNGVVLETIPAGDPRIVETPPGPRIGCAQITGYPYNIGDSLDVEVSAVVGPMGEALSVGGLAVPMLICFARGTHMLTPAGEKRVEDLSVGDRIVTRDHGVQPIRWLGATHLPANALAARPDLRPVRIKAGTLGPDTPVRDLPLSR